MTQYIVAYDDDNLESKFSVLDEDSVDDVFKVKDNLNIHGFFSGLYMAETKEKSMPKGALYLVTDKMLDEILDKYPADGEVAELVSTVMDAIGDYPDKAFFYTYE